MVISQIFGTIFKGVSEIIPDVYQLTVRGANIIVIAEKELTLVDAGLPGSSSQVVDFIHSLGRSVAEVSLIILTHNHIDHAGGLAELRRLTNARVAAHHADIAAAKRQGHHPGITGKQPRTPFPGWRSIFSVKFSEVDIRLAGEELLPPLGGLRVVHTPGHTPGSISLFSSSNKILFAGDALNKRYHTLRLPPKLASTDLAQAIDSVKRIARLDVDILCLGHGRPLTEDFDGKVQELIAKVKD